MLQEKILLLNEKLSNVFEEITGVKKFHSKLIKFFKGSESSEPSEEECEDYDDLDLDGLSNQAAEMDLEGWALNISL